jgi:hypothetical protein
LLNFFWKLSSVSDGAFIIILGFNTTCPKCRVGCIVVVFSTVTHELIRFKSIVIEASLLQWEKLRLMDLSSKEEDTGVSLGLVGRQVWEIVEEWRDAIVIES